MSFSGSGLGGFQGLGGVIQATRTGAQVLDRPSCVTAAERQEANENCQNVSLHGLGTMVARAPMTGRFAGRSPCEVKEFPDCPTPTCIDEQSSAMIVGCLSGQGYPGLDCNDPTVSMYLYFMTMLPFCKTPPLPPGCVPKEMAPIVQYCQKYPEKNGPDKKLNALCWGVTHDAAYWSALQKMKVCAPPKLPSATPAPVKPPPPPTMTKPPAYKPPPAPPQEVPPLPPVHETSAPPDVEEPPEHRESAMMGMWGILALLAVGGGGYYLYRRYK